MIPNVVSAAALAVIFLNVFNAQYGIINSFVKTVTGKPFMKNWFFDQNSAFITGSNNSTDQLETNLHIDLHVCSTNGGPGDTTLNLPLYLYKTSMTDNNYGYANMMGVILIIAGVIVVSAINRLFKMNEADY